MQDDTFNKGRKVRSYQEELVYIHICNINSSEGIPDGSRL